MTKIPLALELNPEQQFLTDEESVTHLNHQVNIKLEVDMFIDLSILQLHSYFWDCTVIAIWQK